MCPRGVRHGREYLKFLLRPTDLNVTVGMQTRVVTDPWLYWYQHKDEDFRHLLSVQPFLQALKWK